MRHDPVFTLADEILRELGSPPDENIPGQRDWLKDSGYRRIAQHRVASLIRLRMATFLGDRLMEPPRD